MTLMHSYAGVTFSTPAQAWEWLENQRHLTDREKRRAAAWIDRWETTEGHKIVERLKATSAQIKEARTRNLQIMEDGQRRAVEVEHLMSTHRMSVDEGLKELTVLQKRHAECLQVQASLRESAKRWQVDADPHSL